MSKKTAIPSKSENHLATFLVKTARRTRHNGKGWFSVANVGSMPDDSSDAGVWRLYQAKGYPQACTGAATQKTQPKRNEL